MEKKLAEIMDRDRIAKTISKNLRRIAYEQQKTQTDISHDIGISTATLSSWFNGTRIPRMDKIDLLCHYFSVTRSDIMEPYDPDRERDFPLTLFEIELIKAYRSASNGIKESVDKLLDVKKKGNEKHQTVQFSA